MLLLYRADISSSFHGGTTRLARRNFPLECLASEMLALGMWYSIEKRKEEVDNSETPDYPLPQVVNRIELLDLDVCHA